MIIPFLFQANNQYIHLSFVAFYCFETMSVKGNAFDERLPVFEERSQ